MPTFFWGIITPLIAFIIQIVWWRIRLPRYQTKAVLAIFMATLIIVIVTLHLFGTPGQGLTPTTSWQYLHIALMHISLLMAWIITYSAFEADSPTLVMVARLLQAGKEGVSETDLIASMSDEVLLVPRVDDLIRDAMATLDESGRYHITNKGRMFLLLVYGYRRLLGASTGG